MSSEEKDKRVEPHRKKAPSGGRAAKEPKALDRWFDDALNKLYVDVVNEPLPDDLARLVSQLKTKKLN